MNNNLLIGAAMLILGGAGGYIAGQGGGSQDETSASAEATALAARKASRLSNGSAAGASKGSSGGRSSSSMSFREIMNEPGQTRRVQALMDYYAGLSPDEFAAEAEKLNELPFGERILAGTLFFSRWAEVAPEEAMAYAQGMGRDGFFARPAVMRSWSSSDPLAAAKYYEENSDTLGRGRGPGGGAAGQIAREWAKQDPQAALAWAQGLEGEAGSDAVGDIFSQVAIDDPARAAQMAANLSGDQQAEAYESIAREWSRKDFGAAEQWINSLPSDQRDGAMAEAIRGLADSDPAMAASKVASLSDEDAIQDAVRSVTRNWASEDPAATAQWLVQQNTEELGRPMYETMRNWSSQDPAAALDFVNAQPEGEIRDTAVSSYVMVNRDADPQESLALAVTITDDGARARSMGISVQRWAQEDEAAATQYVESLSDEQQSQIAEWAENSERERGRRDFGRGGGRGR